MASDYELAPFLVGTVTWCSTIVEIVNAEKKLWGAAEWKGGSHMGRIDHPK